MVIKSNSPTAQTDESTSAHRKTVNYTPHREFLSAARRLKLTSNWSKLIQLKIIALLLTKRQITEMSYNRMVYIEALAIYLIFVYNKVEISSYLEDPDERKNLTSLKCGCYHISYINCKQGGGTIANII